MIRLEFVNSSIRRDASLGIGLLQVYHKSICLELVGPCMLVVDIVGHLPNKSNFLLM
jgi:hypothetical protein